MAFATLPGNPQPGSQVCHVHIISSKASQMPVLHCVTISQHAWPFQAFNPSPPPDLPGGALSLPPAFVNGSLPLFNSLLVPHTKVEATF